VWCVGVGGRRLGGGLFRGGSAAGGGEGTTRLSKEARCCASCCASCIVAITTADDGTGMMSIVCSIMKCLEVRMMIFITVVVVAVVH